MNRREADVHHQSEWQELLGLVSLAVGITIGLVFAGFCLRIEWLQRRRSETT